MDDGRAPGRCAVNRQPLDRFLRSQHSHHVRLARLATACGQTREAAYQLGLARGYRFAWRRLAEDRRLAAAEQQLVEIVSVQRLYDAVGVYR